MKCLEVLQSMRCSFDQASSLSRGSVPLGLLDQLHYPITMGNLVLNLLNGLFLLTMQLIATHYAGHYAVHQACHYVSHHASQCASFYAGHNAGYFVGPYASFYVGYYADHYVGYYEGPWLGLGRVTNILIRIYQNISEYIRIYQNKLGLSCAKLRRSQGQLREI